MGLRTIAATILTVSLLTSGTVPSATAADGEVRPDPTGDVVFRGYDKDKQEPVVEPTDDPGVDIVSTSIRTSADAVVLRTELAQVPDGEVALTHALMRAREKTAVGDPTASDGKFRSLVWVVWHSDRDPFFQTDERYPCEPAARLDGRTVEVTIPTDCLGPFADLRLDLLSRRSASSGANRGSNRDDLDAGTFSRAIERPVVRPELGGGTSMLWDQDAAGDAATPHGDLLEFSLTYSARTGLSSRLRSGGDGTDVTSVRLLVADGPGEPPLFVFAARADDQTPDWFRNGCGIQNSEWGLQDGTVFFVNRSASCLDDWPAVWITAEIELADGTVDRSVEIGPMLPGPGASGFDDDPSTVEVAHGTDWTLAEAYGEYRFPEAGSAPFAVVATSADFPDALAGTALLGEAPLFFSNGPFFASGDHVERAVGPGGTVHLLGGTSAIPVEVERELTDRGLDVVRLKGTDRIATSIAIAKEVLRRHPGTTIALARARGTTTSPEAGWVDSISAGAWSAKTSTPVLLTGSSALDPRVAQFIKQHGITDTVLLGGQSALSQAVEDAAPNPRRVAGSDRASTAVAVSRTLLPGTKRHILIDGHHAYDWPNGLVMAGVAADLKASILLRRGRALPTATKEMLASCPDVMVTGQGLERRLVVAVEEAFPASCG